MSLRVSGRTGRHECINGLYEPLAGLHNGHKAWKSLGSQPRFIFHTGKTRWVITDELGDGVACWAYIKQGGGDTPAEGLGNWSAHNADGSWGVDPALKVERVNLVTTSKSSEAGALQELEAAQAALNSCLDSVSESKPIQTWSPKPTGDNAAIVRQGSSSRDASPQPDSIERRLSMHTRLGKSMSGTLDPLAATLDPEGNALSPKSLGSPIKTPGLDRSPSGNPQMPIQQQGSFHMNGQMQMKSSASMPMLQNSMSFDGSQMMPPGYPMPPMQLMPWDPTEMQEEFSMMEGMYDDHEPGLFDAHVHLFDFFQHSEGIGELLEAMDSCGVSHAALCGCPLKKNWSEFEERRAPDPFNDTDILYFFSLTDFYLRKALKKCPPRDRARLMPLMCGFNPTDKSCSEHIEHNLKTQTDIKWRGLGKIYLRASEITNLTMSSRATPKIDSFDLIMITAMNNRLPVIVQHNASSESTKAYKTGFEYVHELDWALKKHPSVKVLWVDGGMFCRGDWQDYEIELDKMLKSNVNLYISLSPSALKLTQVPRKALQRLCETNSERFMVGSSTMGVFSSKAVYKKEWGMLKEFLGGLTLDTQEKVGFLNAKKFFKPHGRSGQRTMMMLESKKNGLKADNAPEEYAAVLHDVFAAKELDKIPPGMKHMPLKGFKDGKLDPNAPVQEIKHVTIDTHLHMLDFLQKSSGLTTIMQAMDGCGVEKAVMIGMPCCKKWSKDEPEKPLYYQDDNGQCYFYSYADQMVADAWLALPDEKRKRFAPVMASINPTDIAAVEHVRRLWDKYPGLFRGMGEVMCRHDDLTMLLQDNETPVINHMAMKPVYEFCIEKDINCMVHHNADRTAEVEKDKFYEYLWEVQQVLEEFPRLKLVWCHAGMSRRTYEETHGEMIDRMVTAYPNLIVDISWVVWEEVICKPDGSGVPKPMWIKVFEKHPTRFTIGSDQVGQFIGPAGHNWLKPEIVKYWTLSDCLKPETAKAILYDNAERIWFKDWDMPSVASGNPRFRQIPACYQAETLHMNEGKFVPRGECF